MGHAGASCRAAGAAARRIHFIVALALLACLLSGLGAAGARVWAAEPAPTAGAPRAFTHRSLHARTRAWRSAAALQTPAALDQLIAAYDRAGENLHGRALLASIACDAFGAAEHLPRLAGWRDAHDDPRDSWLWFRTLACEVRAGTHQGAVALALGDAPAWKRAVAIEALAGKPGETLPELYGDASARLPADPLERALLLEALTDLWVATAQAGTPAAQRDAGLWLVQQLELPQTPERARRSILRGLRQAFRLPAAFEEPGYWRDQLLAQERTGATERVYASASGPSFLDLEGTGRRVVYVIDCSGSMVELLTRQEREDLSRNVGKPPKGQPGQRSGKGKVVRTSAWRGWSHVERRIDAAKELVRYSLASLPEGASFAIVLFASKHAYLHATPGLVEATPARVAEALKDLDRVVAGSASPLGGGTNLHGGLTRALQTRSAGSSRSNVPFADLLEAPDTLFVLSDGSPGQDDWSDEDPQRRPSTTFDPHADAGTFYDPDQLLDDAARLNLLRRCEIHCVGLGVAPTASAASPAVTPGAVGPMSLPTLLERLAALGHGRFRPVPLTSAPPPSDPRAAAHGPAPR